MSDLPYRLSPDLSAQLVSVLDVEGKIVRGLDALGSLAGRDVLLIDAAGSTVAAGLTELGATLTHGAGGQMFRSDLPDETVDVVIGLWSAFPGVRRKELAEAERILRPGGRLMIVHDYGRDDVSRIEPDRPEYGDWGRRKGPYLSRGFRVRVLHCFWTFESAEATAAFLAAAFGDAGAEVAATLKRPRLSYNVAIYHRTRGGDAAAPAGGEAPATTGAEAPATTGGEA